MKDMNVADFVRIGSRLKEGGPYIATSRSYATVQRKYASERGGPVVAIDLRKIHGTYIDLSVEAVRNVHIKPSDPAWYFARADEEVLIVGYVPPTAIVIVGP
ncbi:MAG: hypothetical protein H6748_03360 [Spirochaetaceae bacterium]|nr:hypothetical protein [Spirochaetaceae bacterium]